jgi:hypothetical protein
LQFNKRISRKKFIIKEEESDGDLVKLSFIPVNHDKTCFSGSIWIDLINRIPVKIDLHVDETPNHPFLPIFSHDSISNVGISISYTFSGDPTRSLDHINFEYRFNYLSRRLKNDPVLIPKTIDRKIFSKGLLFFYDYEEPFILPYFSYNNDLDDYRKLSFIPYNEDFWDHNNQLLLTGQQKENLGFFAQEGTLVNYHSGNYGTDFIPIHNDPILTDDHSLFENNYLFWAPDKRIRLKPEQLSSAGTPPVQFTGVSIYDRFHLEVQILLDINIINNKLVSRSYTVFDPGSTFYRIPPEEYTPAFINIYFDLYEIGRRKMQTLLDSRNYSVTEATQLYQKTLEEIGGMIRTYFQEVQLGANKKYMHKWNDYVQGELGTDNLKGFDY